jgi:hypothetical protein
MTLLPDCGGHIRTLAAALHPEMFRSDHRPFDREYAAMRRALAGFMERLAPGMRLILFTEERAARAADRWLARIASPANIDLRPLPDDVMSSASDMWFQDPVIVAECGRTFLRPMNHAARGHADWLAAALGGEARTAQVGLDGGNLLVGPDFMLVGADDVQRSAEPALGGSRRPAEGLARLAALDLRPLHAVGDSAGGQPLFHIDLFLSVTGLAAGGRPLLVLAEPQAVFRRHAGETAVLAGWLDDAEARLSDAGFAIRRLPVPLAPTRYGRKTRLRASLNGLIENDPRAGCAHPIVWVPGFADLEPELQDFDIAATEFWRSLGFEPRLCPGWSAAAHVHGALRCAVKVVERAPTA